MTMSERIRQCGYDQWEYCDGNCFSCVKRKSRTYATTTTTTNGEITLNGGMTVYAEVVPSGKGTTHWFECSACHGPVDIGDSYCRHCGMRLKKDADNT